MKRILLSIWAKTFAGKCALALLFPWTVSAALQVGELRCEYLVNPQAVGTARPRLSWVLESGDRDQVQTFWQVQAASTRAALEGEKDLLWDSGKGAGDETLHVEYAGKPLRSGQRVWWRVRVWDRSGVASAWSDPAFWGVGLLKASDWQAEWIGIGETVRADKPPHNGFHSELFPTAATNQWVMIDLGKTQSVDRLRLHPARPFDWTPDTPGFLFPLRYRVEGALDRSFSNAVVWVDQTQTDQKAVEPVTHDFPAAPARFVRMSVSRLARRDGNQHAFALAEMELFSGTNLLSRDAAVSASSTIETAAWGMQRLVDGQTVPDQGGRGSGLPAALLRKTFTVEELPSAATLYATALGVYEARLNGDKIGDQLLAPEWTDYRKRAQYQAYDVLSHVRRGPNVIGAVLADGWYAGRLGLSGIVPGGPSRGIYGKAPRLLMQLVLEYRDGRRQIIGSDETWKSTSDGPIRLADLLDGEAQDFSKTLPGWDEPGFADGHWDSVKTGAPVRPELSPQPNEPIRMVEELSPIAISEPDPGVFIFDLGQNMVGWCRFKARGRSGQHVVFRHAEALDGNGRLYTNNLRGVPQRDEYILQGAGEEICEPHFTYHGFRFVEVRGLESKPSLSDLAGVVLASSAPLAGEFESSSPLLNQLMRNILWTQRGNMHSVPTDCPQRDERLGWMGDAQVFAQTACYNLNMAAFFSKWTRDVREAQTADGRFPDFAPHPYVPEDRFSGAPGWAEAGVVVPWRVYENYADRQALAENFESARRWIEFVRVNNPDLIWRHKQGNAYNDWLNADTQVLEGWPKQGGAVPKELFATAWFAYATELTAKMAAVLGEEKLAENYGKLRRDIGTAFAKEFVQSDGKILGETQAGYALALSFGLVPPELESGAFERLLAAFKPYGGRLSTGFPSTIRLMLELSRRGRDDLAWKLVTLREFPSWGYMIDQGATTIWERWDGYVAGRGFQDPGMNSLNHYAFGSIGEWIWRVAVGLNLDEAQPGWKHFIIRPRPGGGVTWIKAAHHSVRGPIRVHWEQEAERFVLRVNVPANTTATVVLPKGDPARVKVDGAPLASAPGVHDVRAEGGETKVRVGSGVYSFFVE